ncbi:MAG: AAA family ATPase [Actinomycetota bacterium]|nr:AAA family ATPase [Actinomycetota bacterium]
MDWLKLTSRTDTLATRSILIVDTDTRVSDVVVALLDGHKIYQVRNVSDAQRKLVEEGIELAIIGPGFAHEAGVTEVALLFDVQPNLPIVLIADGLTTDVLRASIRAGFKDVLDVPIDRSKIDSMLRHIEKAEAVIRGDRPARAKIGKVVTIMSPKGGAGKTMTAVNVGLAIAMAGDEPERVVIMDADLQFGDVCISLQVEPEHTIVDAARDIEKLDEAMLESLLATHSSGMRVLSSPLEPSLADEISTQVVVRTLGMLKRMFDYVIIDTAPFLDEPILSILERSDTVLLVVDMDLPAVKNAKLALDTLKLIKFPFEKIKLVLNRVNSKARLDISELERTLGLEVQAAISSDKLVPRSVNEGEPVVSLYPRSRVAKDLRGVAALVIDGGTVDDGQEERRGWFK